MSRSRVVVISAAAVAVTGGIAYAVWSYMRGRRETYSCNDEPEEKEQDKPCGGEPQVKQRKPSVKPCGEQQQEKTSAKEPPCKGAHEPGKGSKEPPCQMSILRRWVQPEFVDCALFFFSLGILFSVLIFSVLVRSK